MESIIIDTSQKEDLIIGATGIQDIKQCIHILLSTMAGTVFLDRELGLDPSIVDIPVNKIGLINQEIFQKIGMYEPRVKVKDIKTEPQSKIEEINKLRIIVEVDILEEYL